MAGGRHRWDGWRAVLIPAALVTAMSHVPITEAHIHEAPYIGALFVAFEVVGVVLAVLLARRGDRTIYLAAAAVGGAAIVAYVLSRSVGLPLIRDDVGNWLDPLGLVALAAEAVLLFGGAAAASGRVGFRVTRRVAVLGASSLLCAGIGATILASAAEPGMADASTAPRMTLPLRA